MPTPEAIDEGRHSPGPELLWGESWYLDWFGDDGSLGGYVRLGLYPNLGLSWYWACLVGPDRPLVTVIDHEAPIPPGTGLELRASGLWSEIIAQTPLEHMTVGLEAFGVALDDPSEVYRSGYGERTPLGLDLEWETDGGTFAYDVTTRYEIPCRVHGEILVGAERIDFDGWGQRDHSWGVRDWWRTGWCWSAGRLADGSRWHMTAIDPFAIGYMGEPGGGRLHRLDAGAVDAPDGPEGMPAAIDLTVGDLEIVATPLAWAPVRLDSPDGRVSRFPRALCELRAGDGRTGHGWIELNQPQQ